MKLDRNCKKLCTATVTIFALLLMATYFRNLRNVSWLFEQNCENNNIRNLLLPAKALKKIQHFLFFIGYQRSGHSIVGSILDAHPHIVVSHELQLLKEWDPAFNTRGNKGMKLKKLYNKIYENSVLSSCNKRKESAKGYTLEIRPSWQGRYDQYIQIIGDKSGGGATVAYLRNKTEFIMHYKQLKALLPVPIKVIHVIRNPYDNIATEILYQLGIRELGYGNAPNFVTKLKNNDTAVELVSEDEEVLFKVSIRRYFNMAHAVTDLITLIGRSNVLVVHHRDLVHQPRQTIADMLSFLGVEAKQDYLQACASKVFRQVNQSRKLIVWQDKLRRLVKKRMIFYPDFFKGYSFTSD